MTKSVLSGKWWLWQKAKYDESDLRVAPLVSSEAGLGNTSFHHEKNLEG